jgi:hypothetical protein
LKTFNGHEDIHFFGQANYMPAMLSPNGRVSAHARTSRAFRPAAFLAVMKEMPSRVVYPERRPFAHAGAARAIIKPASLARRPNRMDTGWEDRVERTRAARCVARLRAVAFAFLLIHVITVGDRCWVGGTRRWEHLAWLLDSCTTWRLRCRGLHVRRPQFLRLMFSREAGPKH